MEPNQPSAQPGGQPAIPNLGTANVLAPKKRGFWMRTRQVVARLLLIVLVLGFAGLLFVQLPIFKRLVVGELVSTIESSTNGTLVVGEINGNLLEGFVMNDVTLRLKTGTKYDTVPFIHADHIIAKYSLLRWLWKNEFSITELVLQRPVIRFVKFAGDTMWNYDLLTKPVPTASKAPPKPFTQIVDLSSFRIQDGSLIVRDYNYPARPPQVIVANAPNATSHRVPKAIVAQIKEDEIDWSDMKVEGIDLDGHLYADGSSAQSVRVNHLRFIEKQSGFFVQNLEFSGYRDSIQARIDDAKITTGHSEVSFSIELAPPKIIETGLLTSMKHSSVKATVSGPVISTYELKQFFPEPLGFLAGSPGIDLVANGEFGKLHIKKLGLDFKGQGTLSLAGDLDNLHQADSLWMNINLWARNLSNTTLDDYVPGLHLPNLSRFGTINISNLTFTGEPLNFHAKFAAQSSGAGGATGDVILDLRNHNIAYRAGMKTTNFNLAAIANGKQFESSITAETQLAGRGTNWKTMNSTITAKTDAPSVFGKYHITSANLAGAIRSGTITTDHLDAMVQGGPEVHIRSAMVGLTNPRLPFRFDGTVKDFQVAEVLNSKNPARIDLDANLVGSAKDFEDLTGTAQARLFDLEYRGHALPDDTVDLKISPTSPGENNLTLRSQIADVTIDRRFQLGTLTEEIPAHLNALLTAIEQREFPENGAPLSLSSSCADSIDFDYHIQVKDLRPLADFFPRTFLLGQGVIYGTARGCPDGDLNLTANGDSVAFILRNRQVVDTNLVSANDTTFDTILTRSDTALGSAAATPDSGTIRRKDTSALTLPQFGVGTPRIQFMPTTFRLTLDHLSNDPHTVLDHLDASLDFLSDSVVRLGSALLFHPKFGLVYKNQKLDFDMATVYNDALGIRLKGDAHFPEGNFNFALDTLLLNYINPYYTPGTLLDYAWVNEGPAHIRLSKSGRIEVDTITLLHSLRNGVNPDNVDAMRMKIAGTLEGDTVSAALFVPSFNLEELKKIIPPFKPNAKTLDFASFIGKVRDMNVTLTGTLERPDLSAKLYADSLTYGEGDNPISFDSNALNLEYRDQALRGTLSLHVANFTTNAPGLQSINPAVAKGKLVAVIDSIPITLALKRGPNYAADSARAAARPLAAHIDANNFPLDVATPFLPPFRQVQGTGDIHFSVTGTRNNIDYAGNASVQNGAILLDATNMWYRFDGPLSFAHNALTLQNITVNNIDADDPHGQATLNGSLDFSGFNITNFDLRLRTNELMVLSDAAKATQLAAYGPVIINTGGEDFHFRNTFKAPWINGTVNIMSANITMPQTTGPAQSVSNAGIIYETLPNDSIERLNAVRSRILSDGRPGHRMAALEYAVGAQSVQMSSIDDTLFPNWMKNIYLNDDGSVRVADTSNSSIAASNGPSPSFADILRMDLRINTQGNATISIPFGGALGLIGAELKAELASGGTLSIERGDDLQSIAEGSFDLSPNSSFTFYKTFNISKGTITFRKNFSNPQINIVADYPGTHFTQSGSDNVRIELTITGTKDRPILTAKNYEQIGGTWEERSEPSPEAAKEDAIYFLATGQFKNELTSGANTNVTANILPNLGAGLGASVLNNLLGSTSQQIALQSATLNIGGTAPGAQITAAYHNITFKFGGYNYTSGTSGQFGINLTTDIPLSEISTAAAARDMTIEIQGNSNPSVAGANALTQQPVFLAKWVWTFLRW